MKLIYSEKRKRCKLRVLPAINYSKQRNFSTCDTPDQLDELNSMSFEDVPNMKEELNTYLRSVASGSLDINFNQYNNVQLIESVSDRESTMKESDSIDMMFRLFDDIMKK